jgi:uncharacterized protein YyaL (SSP411 family)
MKSYLRFIQWKDDLCYMQGQGYWMLGNIRLFELTGDDKYREIAGQCAHAVLEQQRSDGAWDYPNPEWKNRVATAEGVWVTLGLLATYRQTQEQPILDGVLRWHTFMENVTGYQEIDDQVAVNYFAYREGARIPNNTAFTIRFLAELADVTNDNTYLARCDGMVNFISAVQLSDGKIPYAVEGEKGGEYVENFQSYQYNAFQCLDLMRYHELTGDGKALSVVQNILDFLKTGIGKDGHVYYEVGKAYRTVTYHTAVTAAAFYQAGQIGMTEYRALAERAYDHVLKRQHRDGSFPHSFGDYHLLSDQRSYPRYLAMILYHLLHTQSVPEKQA